MRDGRRGFSLIELLIVVAVILVVAAIAIPNLLRSKASANEASAVGSLRTLNTACIVYVTTYGGFPKNLKSLGGMGKKPFPSSTASELIDNVLETGIKSGYTFVFSAAAADAAGEIDNYTITAKPLEPGTTGLRYFFTDQTGVIRASAKKAATLSSTPIS